MGCGPPSPLGEVSARPSPDLALVRVNRSGEPPVQRSVNQGRWVDDYLGAGPRCGGGPATKNRPREHSDAAGGVPPKKRGGPAGRPPFFSGGAPTPRERARPYRKGTPPSRGPGQRRPPRRPV